MLQIFPLDVAKVDPVLHMLQWTPFVAAACMRVGVERALAVGTGNRAGADRDESGRGIRSEHGTRGGMGPHAGVWRDRLDASAFLDIRTLAFPFFFSQIKK